jgi:hypothetical protein
LVYCTKKNLATLPFPRVAVLRRDAAAGGAGADVGAGAGGSAGFLLVKIPAECRTWRLNTDALLNMSTANGEIRVAAEEEINWRFEEKRN